MRSDFLSLSVLVAAIATGACGAEFEPQSRVTDFRLIAVGADKPYAAPGEEVSLSTLSHEPFGRPVTWAWTTCVKPSATTVNACLGQAGAGGVTMGQGLSSFKTTIPANILDGVPAGAAANVYVGVVTVACPGALSLGDFATLSTGDLPFRCVDANTGEDLSYDRYVVSVKRVYVRRNDKNENPVIGAVTWDGAPWAEGDIKEVAPCKNDPVAKIDDCDGGEKHDLTIESPPEVAESGTSEAGSPFAEDVVAQYYGSEGLFEFDTRIRMSPKTSWAARAAAAGKEQTLWFVLRDNRGGVSWTTRKVRVR